MVKQTDLLIPRHYRADGNPSLPNVVTSQRNWIPAATESSPSGRGE